MGKKFELLMTALKDRFAEKTQESLGSINARGEALTADAKNMKLRFLQDQKRFADNQKSLSDRPFVESRAAFVDQGSRTVEQVRKDQLDVLTAVSAYNDKFNSEAEFLREQCAFVPKWNASIAALDVRGDIQATVQADQEEACASAKALTAKQYRIVRMISLFSLLALFLAGSVLLVLNLSPFSYLWLLPPLISLLLIPIMFIVTTILKHGTIKKRIYLVQNASEACGQVWLEQAGAAIEAHTAAILEALQIEQEINVLADIHEKSFKMFCAYYQSFLPERIIYGRLPAVIDQISNGSTFADAMWRSDCLVDNARQEALRAAHWDKMEKNTAELCRLNDEILSVDIQNYRVSVESLVQSKKQTELNEKQLAAQQAQVMATMAMVNEQSRTNRKLDGGVQVKATVDHYWHD